MNRLVPRFIEERLRRGDRQGSFDGSGLFVDISGFSRLTDMAFTLEEVGAEPIGREIPRLFDAPVREVIEAGGIITHFAGDAFLALFPGDAGGVACRAAASIVRHFAAHGRAETPHGVFEFAVRCGVDVGHVAWGIVQGQRLAGWYFRGGPVEGATTQQGRAGQGQVACSPAVVRQGGPSSQERTASIEPANDPRGRHDGARRGEERRERHHSDTRIVGRARTGPEPERGWGSAL